MGYAQPDAGLVGGLPQHHLGRKPVHGQAVLRVEQPVLQPAQRRNLAVELHALTRGQHQSGGMRVEVTQRHIRAVSDVTQILQNAGLARAFEVRREDVADVDAKLLRMQGELDALFGGVGARHHLNERPGLDPAGLLHGHPHDLFELVGGQRPELGDAAGEPNTVLVQIDQAMPHEGTQRVEVDVIAVGTAERRVQRAAVAPQMLGRPVLRLLTGDSFTGDRRGHSSLPFQRVARTSAGPVMTLTCASW